MNQTQPLVTCITPTYNRLSFLELAILQWQEHTWTHKELVIVDDGEESAEKIVKSFSLPNITYIRWPERISIGRKRNIACEHAKGVYIAHFDDDDWNHPKRLEEQVNVLRTANVSATGYNSIYIYNQATDRAIHYYEDPYTLVGGTLMYQTAYWKSHRFPDVSIGEDTYFMRRIPYTSLIGTNGINRYVAIDGHGYNISNRDFSQWLARYPEVKASAIHEMVSWPTPKSSRKAKWQKPLISCT